MDIVSRLKKFLELTAIPITQFADTATIPRPTLSQILNGRNKKISNEILDKIHTGYPDLNMMWLMFGDGDMLVPGASLPVYNPTEQAPSAEDDDQSADMATETTDEAEAAADDATRVAEGIQGATQITVATDAKKKIQNIMVFYTDSSYELFVPANR